MSEAAKGIRIASWSALYPRTWPEWRLLLGGVLVASAGLSVYYLHQWSQWTREARRTSQNQALEIRELMTDLRTARGELRIAQAQNDLLTTRRMLALARRALEQRRLDDAQVHLAQAAGFLKGVSPHVLDVNAARLERLKNEFAVADLHREASGEAADQVLRDFATELDALIGE